MAAPDKACTVSSMPLSGSEGSAVYEQNGHAVTKVIPPNFDHSRGTNPGNSGAMTQK